ncbi:hypothetical protein LUZ60_005092 [Juncus effusus]|nr:hypothetical protein LUZ60_005092 [Juncus effusus]
MATNGAHTNEGAKTENSLEKIKKQLSSSSSSGRYFLQGPLLKRSETLRNWNERWVILDPTSGRMEYKIRRNEPTVKGSIYFDATSSITLSPVNFHVPKYDGCCFYIGTPQKKDYFLCAETPGAAKAWISTLHATQLVLKAHKEAVNSLSTGNTNTGTVHTVVAAANRIAMEASGEIEAAMKASLRANLGFVPNLTVDRNNSNTNAQLEDDLSIMKETLRVKDEELGQLAKDVRGRDATINELAQKLTETARAAQDAARAAQSLDEQRRRLFNDMELVRKDAQNQIQSSFVKVRESEQKATELSKQNEILTKQKESAEQESHLWRAELAKARDQRAVLEASVARAEERIRVSESEAEERAREASRRLEEVERERDELVGVVRGLQSQFQRKQGLREGSLESSSGSGESSPLTKHVDKSEESDDVDKACVVSAGEDDDVQVEDEIRIADVREISPEGVREISPQGEEMDVRVVGPAS